MLFSVIIPVYNSSSTISRCVESVVQSIQDVTEDYEVICIDDGSEDESLQILNFISSVNSKVKVFHKDNGGVSSARNLGLEMAKGEYIAFNDSDDQWTQDHISVLYELLLNNPSYDCISANHEVEKRTSCKYGVRKIFTDLYEVNQKIQQFRNYFSPPTSLIRRCIIDEGVRFDSSKLYVEDALFYSELLRTHKCLYYNRKVSSNIEHKFLYGDKGLSSNMREMEKGDLFRLKYAHENLEISSLVYCTAVAYSIIKYWRRLGILKLRKWKQV